MTKEKLKPCPFCGGEAEFAEIDIYGSYDEKLDLSPVIGKEFKVTCKSRCDVSQTRGYRKTEQQAISAWNKRIREK